ncbi:MAG: IS3 family transposase, partial [Chloroflexi bacterium]|nr:IS3 family transposase [Chloroflexota bacterium]
HQASRGSDGAARVRAGLTLGQGIACGRKRVARLMRVVGLAGIHRRRHHGMTRRDPRRPLFPDRVQRDFTPSAPDRLWVADLTQHRTAEGWLYAGVVLDAFSRRVIGWAMDERPITGLAVNSLRMAVRNRRPGPWTVHHSDHGAQYTALAFGRALQAAGLQGSMGHVGSALDNAVAESFFATLQTELLDRHSWSTRQQLRSAIFDYIEGFYNRQRRHSTLGYLSPAEYERRWNDQGTSVMLGPAA